MLNELYTFAETCSGGPFFKSKMGEIYFTTYNISKTGQKFSKIDNFFAKNYTYSVVFLRIVLFN